MKRDKFPIKIAILLPTLAYGGAEKLILDELKVLCKDRRFNFEVILLFEKGPLYDEFKRLSLRIKAFESSHNPFKIMISYLKIYRYLRLKKFDLLHIHLLYKPVILIFKFINAKFLLTVHNIRAFSFFEKVGFFFPDKVIACGERTYQFLTRYISNSKVVLLPNGVEEHNIKYDKAKLKVKYKIKDNYPIILSIGRLTQEKGFVYLIKSVSLLKKDFPRIKLLIAGDGELREKLQGLINELDLVNHVKLLGIIKNVFELFKISDAYVNSSLWEGLPMTLLEAMSMKIPIIATDVGSNSEVVINGYTGLLVKPQSEYEIAKAVKKIINNPTLGKKLAENAYKLFKEKYTIEKHCENLANLYLSVSS